MTKIGKCQNCHEKDCELEEIEINGIKKEVCDSCIMGKKIVEEENRWGARNDSSFDGVK